MRGWRAWARLNGSPLQSDHALLPPFFSLFPTFVSIRVHSWFYYSPFRAFRAFRGFFLLNGRARPSAPATHCPLLPPPYSPLRIARRFCRARCAQARQPRTAFSSLLPNLYYPMFIDTHFDGLKLFKPEVFSDSRGTFSEIWKREELREWGLFFEVIQENESVSRRGVMRGLHFQAAPFGQSKLIRVPHGRVFDVVVDLRRSSSTFGKHFSVELSSENHLQLFVPRGFAHGFAVLSDEAVFSYKVDSPWTPNAERCIRLDDPAIAIEWPIPPGERILSEKDSRGIFLQEWIQGNEEAE